MTSADAYGHSLALVDGDLVLANGALEAVSGVANLLQALVLRVLTPLGSDVFNATYGLDVSTVFAEPTGIRMVKQLITLNLVRTLATDRRVRDVREVLFEDDPAYRARHPEMGDADLRDHRHRRRWAVEVVLDLIDGETLTVPLALDV